MLVIADTSALVAVAACKGLHWLDALFTQVYVPQAVFQEATVFGKPQAEKLLGYLQNKVLEIDLRDFIINTQGLGQGELEAMALYKLKHADRLLIDDLKARKAATHNHIKIIGSVGILLLAKKHGLIPAIKPYLFIIQQSDLHLSKDLIAHALQLAGED
ncbi:DUF3368 domain-containing protein [uncultured Thiothrix sp.]|uniref:DUF3368 domain-containing protein n=1 Tax=uncultured Thiothrix sp. TaxID=223185 RepID=UPI002622B2EF|nr:DUF3368 domain-containing protein [uncultured Thiothrix sp.]